MGKKAVSALLAVVISVAFMPAGSFAEEGMTEETIENEIVITEEQQEEMVEEETAAEEEPAEVPEVKEEEKNTETEKSIKPVSKAAVKLESNGEKTSAPAAASVKKPSRPAILSLKKGNRNIGVKMAKKAGAYNGSYFQVAYRVKGAKKWNTMSGYGQSFSIQNISNGKTYQVKVRAYKLANGSVIRGEWSAIRKVTLPVKLAIAKIRAGQNYVTLTWDKGKKAKSYTIYRKTGSGKYKKLKTVKKTTVKYTDRKAKAGKTYTYKIVKNGKKKETAVRKVKVVKLNKLLSSLKYVTSGNTALNRLELNTKKGYTYRIYRKTGSGSYKKIATRVADSGKLVFNDTSIVKGTKYTYTANCYRISGIVTNINAYDSEGISSIPYAPSVSISCTNLHNRLTWKEVPGATKYKVYRKIGANGSYRYIGTSKSLSYEDVFRQSLNDSERKALEFWMISTFFIDPSGNQLYYAVRPCYVKSGKESLGDYDKFGEFHLSEPGIVSASVTDGTLTIKWGNTCNAEKYEVLASTDGKSFQTIASAPKSNDVCQTKTVSVGPEYSHFSVRAVATRKGKTITSGYDKGFTIIHQKKYAESNVLFLGDSITFGSPYKYQGKKDIFAYPNRVAELTGIRFYNPSIPGSTWTAASQKQVEEYDQEKQAADEEGLDYPAIGSNCVMKDTDTCFYEDRVSEASPDTYPRDRIVLQVARQIRDGKSMAIRTDSGQTVTGHVNSGNQTFKDFDVVVMAAGTNDYLDDAPLGALDSENAWEFNGALNEIMGYIAEGSRQRVEEGKEPIRVVWMDLFYSDRTVHYKEKHNRFVTENGLGLTLTDYQEDVNELISRYSDMYGDEACGLTFTRFSTLYYPDGRDFINRKTCPYMSSDNLHFTRYAYGQIGNELAEFMIRNDIIKE